VPFPWHSVTSKSSKQKPSELPLSAAETAVAAAAARGRTVLVADMAAVAEVVVVAVAVAAAAVAVPRSSKRLALEVVLAQLSPAALAGLELELVPGLWRRSLGWQDGMGLASAAEVGWVWVALPSPLAGAAGPAAGPPERVVVVVVVVDPGCWSWG